MNHTLTSLEIWMRGALMTVAAVGGYLLADPGFTGTITAQQKTWLGAIVVGAITVRSFIDKSTSQAESKAPEPIPVTTLPGDSVETKEADKEPEAN